MIKIHLSRLMGARKENISDVARATGLARNTIGGLYHETTARIDLETIEIICRHYQCAVGELIEFVPDAAKQS